MEGDVGDKVGCKGTGGEIDRPGVVEDEVNGRGVEREGSLVDEGSYGSGCGFMGDIGLGEVRGQVLLGRKRGWAEVGRSACGS